MIYSEAIEISIEPPDYSLLRRLINEFYITLVAEDVNQCCGAQ